ncbi:tyrosine-type recombinase/integrase [Paraburkholderia sp. C35]|uniref:tyrosine-type recombinase/integrase n=1 Tax=Paraburkholderia sp. C35 TaxID=2126993 RepID=UPI000D69B290|nr:tyrosine-type recombinase/integrase [Paraburkholderia sp. C35]
MKLTHATLLNAKPQAKPYKIRAENSLYLLVSVSGSKRWKYDYRIGGKASTLTLGDFPDTNLTDARIKRDAARDLVKAGKDPLQTAAIEKQETIEAGKNTVWLAVNDWFESEKNSWSESYRNSALRYLHRYVRDTDFGALPVRDTRPMHVATLLQSIAKRKTAAGVERKSAGAPHVAIRVRSLLDSAFRRAVTTELIEFNPIASLETTLIKTPETRNNAALGEVELKRLIAAIPLSSTPLTRYALRLLLLTATRTVELREARWKEFDLDHAVWIIPSERMKKRKPHAVPLSQQVMRILQEVKELTKRDKPDDFLLPNTKDASRCMSHAAINKALTRMGFNDDGNWFRAHGCRGTFATWADEAGFNAKAVDRALAHVEQNRVRRSYSKAEYMPERQKMMQMWADYIDSIAR